MRKILFVNACAREESRTLRLAKAVLDKTDGEVTEINLYDENIAPLNRESLAERDNILSEEDYGHEMLKYAREVASADEIVIAAPYWDLSFPSVLKIFIEAVTVSGVTFVYSEEGYPIGRCRAEKMTYVTTSGGPIGDYDFGYSYVKTIFHDMYGIEETKAIRLENLDIAGNNPELMLERAIENLGV